jgi:hypothetical protein
MKKISLKLWDFSTTEISKRMNTHLLQSTILSVPEKKEKAIPKIRMAF